MATDVQGDILNSPATGPAAIRGSALRVIGYGLGMLLSLISVPLLIRHLDGNYWRYVTVISIVTIIQGITDVGLGQIGVREYATRHGSGKARFMSNLLGIRITMTAAGVLLGTLFVLVAGYGHTVVLGTILAGSAMILTVAQGTFVVPLAARLKLGWVTALELLRQALTVAAVVALVIAGAPLLSFLAITIPVAVVVLVATIVVVRHAMPMRPLFEGQEWLVVMRSVLPFVAASVIGAVYLRITVVLMSLMASAQQNNYYAIAFSVVSVLVAIPALTVGSVLPVLAVAAKNDDARLRYIVSRLTDVTLIVGVGMGLALAIGAPFVVRVLSGHPNHPAVVVLRIMSVALLTQFVASAWGYGLLSLRQHRASLVISGVSLVASAAVTAALVPELRANGAAIGFAAAELVMATGSFWFLRSALRGHDFVSLHVPARVVLSGLVALLPLLLALDSAWQAVLSVAIYLAMLIVLRAVPREIAHAIGQGRRGS